jgi:hypothetical protein
MHEMVKGVIAYIVHTILIEAKTIQHYVHQYRDMPVYPHFNKKK